MSCVVVKAGWDLGRRTVDVLVDAAPAGVSESIAHILGDVPAVARVDRVRARLGGSTVVADAQISIVPGTPIERAAAICAAAREAVLARHPEVDITIRAEALPLDQSIVEETVRHVAANLGCNVHDISVFSARTGDRRILHVGFDVEIDGATPLRDAHTAPTSSNARSHSSSAAA